MTDIGVSLPHIIDKKQSNYDIFLKKMPLMVHCMRGEEETARIRRTKESLRGVTLPIGLLALPFLAHAHAIRLGGFFKNAPQIVGKAATEQQHIIVRAHFVDDHRGFLQNRRHHLAVLLSRYIVRA